MFQVPLATSSTIIPLNKFWESIILYHDRPHLINRKLAAISQVLFYEISFNCTAISCIQELFTRSALLYEIRRLKSISKEFITVDFIRSIVEAYDKNVVLTKTTVNDFKGRQNGVYISVRILMGRDKNCNECIEVVILDKERNNATFFAVSEEAKISSAPTFPYIIESNNTSNLVIKVNSFEDADTSAAAWLAEKLFDKLVKWASETLDENNIQSLSLIAADEYCSTYTNLKKKYGAKLVRDWPTKANTDPQKYVFEDIAIASYLICLWEKFSTKENINFVDCGCGNGLLVYILNQEGYKGFGLDIRSRKTWEIYPKDTDLRVGAVTPSSTFPDCTWIVGNHSDELTPWIPVIALRSSPKTNYFVLPCCTYDFGGNKYIRTDTTVSQYADYLNYIKSISERCKFSTKLDKLRIPSTKRTCLVGIRDECSSEEYKQINTCLNDYLKTVIPSEKSYVVRDSTEIVRNCTKLDKSLKTRIINLCINKFLGTENNIETPNGGLWNRGVSIDIPQLCCDIPKEDLKELKKECGGLKTLFKNHRYLFEFEGMNKVRLRLPLELNEITKKYKNKPCWFLVNHPNGCLFDDKTCAYSHDCT